MTAKQESPYTLNTVGIDWVSLSTWEVGQYERVLDGFVRAGKTQEGRVMQYEIVGDGGGAYVGKGKQGGKAHYIMQLSGGGAGRGVESLQQTSWFVPALWKASRLDLQLTLNMDGYVLVGKDWVSRNSGRGVKHEESRQGDTVYIGSKRGEKLVRVYVKHWLRDSLGDYGQHIRVEFQLRRALANRHWQGGRWADSWAELWAGLNGRRERVKGYPSSVCPKVMQTFDNWLVSPPSPIPCLESSGVGTKSWLANSVTSAIKKLSYSHDWEDREFVKLMLSEWGEISKRGESDTLALQSQD